MPHITLVRHGQANTGARDEESYDKLSDLGALQARWLGEHLRDSQDHHSRIYCGALNRHRETALAMGYADDQMIIDPRFNEMEYFTLANAMKDEHGLEIPKEREGFIDHIPKVFAAWQAGQIEGANESWLDFAGRIKGGLDDIAKERSPAIVITSGGVIGMVMRQCLGLDTDATARMVLAVMNSSLHELHMIAGAPAPVLFNAVPHLADPKRHYAQTHL